MMEIGATHPGEAPELSQKQGSLQRGWMNSSDRTQLRKKKNSGDVFLEGKETESGIKGSSKIEPETHQQAFRFKES